jgi:hypothetical protein
LRTNHRDNDADDDREEEIDEEETDSEQGGNDKERRDSDGDTDRGNKRKIEEQKHNCDEGGSDFEEGIDRCWDEGSCFDKGWRLMEVTMELLETARSPRFGG